MPSDELKPVRVFVAMPGTDLGPDAKWEDPRDVRSFYEKVGRALQERLGRKVEVVVEREKMEAGVIHRSMFREAYEADVFLADLTGKNPNVFLELGVRYALRRHVTIPVSQHTARLPFNVEHVRAVQYANRPDDVAIAQLVDLIERGLESRHNDSPVRDVVDVEVVDRLLWERVSGARVSSLVAAAEREERSDERLRLLREALGVAPEAADLRLRLASELHHLGLLDEAVAVLDEGIRLDPVRAGFHHERGVVLGRRGREGDQAAAVEALRRAVELEPECSQYWASLGGAVRRSATARAPQGGDDERLLREAVDCYSRAAELAPYDTYPSLNVVRLRLLLSRFDEEERRRALDRLERLQHLCAYLAMEKPADYWRAFDHADSLLLLARGGEGNREYRRGIELVPAEKRATVLASPLSTLRELHDAGALETAARSAVEEAIGALEAARQAGGPGVAPPAEGNGR